MKTAFKVKVYDEYVFSGTLDGAIRAALRENKKQNMYVASIEIWGKNQDSIEVSGKDGYFYLSTLDRFW